MKNNLSLNINGFAIIIDHVPTSVLTKLESDFSYFIKKNKEILKTFKIHIKSERINIPPNLAASKQSENSITFDQQEVRYNDYYGEAITKFNYQTEVCEIFCENECFLHELIYLLILSRSGKFMDTIGLHKVHACGICIDKKNILLMMDSKGGKTSTFLELLRDGNTKIISDDSPLISRSGEVKEFPLRVGFENVDQFKSKFPYIEDEEIYEFKRKKYSKKWLVSLVNFRNKVGSAEETILIQGFRSTFKDPKIVKIGRIEMFRYLTRHMIIGVGLPLIIEYFLQNTLLDHFKNIKILVSRIIGALRLVKKSKNYVMYCSSNIVLNGQAIKDYFHEE
jgi:hypothetical protein